MSIQNNLVEALRRFECFGKDYSGNSKPWTVTNLMAHNWTGLGYPSYMAKTVQLGYMVPDGRPTPRCLGWYNLTKKGAKIVLAWHKAGVHCENHNVVGHVPFYKDTEKTL